MLAVVDVFVWYVVCSGTQRLSSVVVGRTREWQERRFCLRSQYDGGCNDVVH
jgi:hypothetical protein